MSDRPLDMSGDEANTYFIYAAERNGVELARLIRQAQLVLELQGELYPAQLDHIASIAQRYRLSLAEGQVIRPGLFPALRPRFGLTMTLHAWSETVPLA